VPVKGEQGKITSQTEPSEPSESASTPAASSLPGPSKTLFGSGVQACIAAACRDMTLFSFFFRDACRRKWPTPV
jgi:hypothetical protein